MPKKKSAKITRSVKRTNKWKDAEYMYSSLYAEFAIPPMIRIVPLPTHKEIINTFDKIIETCDAYYPAYIDKGARILFKDYESAVKLFDKGFNIFFQIGDKDTMSDEFIAMKSNLEKFWRWDLIAKYCKEIININPDEPIYYDILSEACAYLGNEEEAIKCAEKALDLEPDDIDYINSAGFIYLTFNRLKKAKEMFNKAIKIDPDYKHAQNNLKDSEYMQERNINLKDLYLCKPDMKEIDTPADDDESEMVEELIAMYNYKRKYAYKLMTIPKYINKDFQDPKHFGTLDTLFHFTSTLHQSYHLNEDIEFFNENIEAVLHKFIFKHRDIDEDILQSVFSGLLMFFGFLSKHDTIDKNEFKKFEKKISKIKNSMIKKMHRYNAIRLDDTMSEDDKEDVR